MPHVGHFGRNIVVGVDSLVLSRKAPKEGLTLAKSKIAAQIYGTAFFAAYLGKLARPP
jgi:hypothetical protein